MKKTALVLILAAFLVVGISSASMAQVPGYWDIKGAIDFGGEIERDGQPDEDADSGFTLVGEYKVPYTAEWTFGGGIRYQLDRETEDTKDDFNFVPFYGLAHYNLQDSPYYFLGHLGYNTFDVDASGVDDTSGGMYYALGAGMDLASNMSAELMYSVNSGEAEISGNDQDVDYSKITVSLGYQF